MNVYSILNSKDFLSKNQFERREIVKNNILEESDCKKGLTIVCFENEILSSSLYFYNKSTVHDVCHLTIGNEYEILDYDKKRKLIKVKNDIDLNMWTTYKRFIFTLTHLRKEKIKKLNN